MARVRVDRQTDKQHPGCANDIVFMNERMNGKARHSHNMFYPFMTYFILILFATVKLSFRSIRPIKMSEDMVDGLTFTFAEFIL